MNSLKSKLGSSKRFYVLTALILLIFLYMTYNVYYLLNLFGPSGLGLPSQMVEKSNQDINLKMLIPGKWWTINLMYGNHGDLDSKMVIESPFFSAAYIQVFTHEFDNNGTQTFLDWGKQKVESNQFYKGISITPYSSPNYSGIIYEYTRPIYALPVKLIWQTTNYHCIDWYILKSNTGYDFSFCGIDKSWDELRNIFLKMIDSIQLD